MPEKYDKYPPHSLPGYQQPFPNYYNHCSIYPRDVFYKRKPPPPPPHHSQSEESDEDTSEYRIPVLESYPWQETVISKNYIQPPTDITKGDRFLVPENATGPWLNHQNDIAWYDGFEWKFDSPSPGWVVFIEDEGNFYHFNNNIWNFGLTALDTDIYFDNTFKTLIISTTLNKD